MSLKSTLSQILRMAHLNAKKQGDGIILYNRHPDFISRGVLVPTLESAVEVASEYLRHIRTHGFSTLNNFVDSLPPSVSYDEVNNTVDRQSSFYVHASPMSTVSRINLLKAASDLKVRALDAAISEVGPSVSSREVKNYRRRKNLVTAHLASSEKVL